MQSKYYLLLFLVGLFIFFSLPLVSSEELYHQQDTDLDFSITSNNATQCNLTKVDTPNGLITINQNGTKSSRTFNFSIASGNYSEIGVYCHNIECFDGISTVSGEECYNINYFGKELSISQSIIYLGLLAILVFVLFATFFGMGFLPNSNQTDEQGKIMSVTYLKYLRLPLWLFAYFLFTGVIFLSSNVAFAFLSEQMFGKILFAIFTVLMAMSPIVVILLLISFFVRFFHDREFQRYFNRGMFPGEGV